MPRSSWSCVFPEYKKGYLLKGGFSLSTIKFKVNEWADKSYIFPIESLHIFLINRNNLNQTQIQTEANIVIGV